MMDYKVDTTWLPFSTSIGSWDGRRNSISSHPGNQLEGNWIGIVSFTWSGLDLAVSKSTSWLGNNYSEDYWGGSNQGNKSRGIERVVQVRWGGNWGV